METDWQSVTRCRRRHRYAIMRPGKPRDNPVSETSTPSGARNRFPRCDSKMILPIVILLRLLMCSHQSPIGGLTFPLEHSRSRHQMEPLSKISLHRHKETTLSSAQLRIHGLEFLEQCFI